MIRPGLRRNPRHPVDAKGNRASSTSPSGDVARPRRSISARRLRPSRQWCAVAGSQGGHGAGRSAPANGFDPESIHLFAVVAHVRHQPTRYDQLLLEG